MARENLNKKEINFNERHYVDSDYFQTLARPISTRIAAQI
jgi:hypothetical protein